MIDITSYVNGYSPVGDIVVMAVVIVLAILIRVTYIRQSIEFKMYKVILLCTFIAAVSNLYFRQSIVKLDESPRFIIYLTKYITHFSVLLALALSDLDSTSSIMRIFNGDSILLQVAI